LKLLMTDALWERPDVSELAKQRLAAANADKQNVAGKRRLLATFGGRDAAILATTDELETAGLAVFDRAKPGQWIDPTTRRATRVARIAPEADWGHKANARRRIHLPYTLTGKTADLGRSPSPVDANRVLLYYQREQLKRGAIEVDDRHLERLFGWQARKVNHKNRVRVIREWALAAKIIERVSDGDVAPIYVFTDGHSRYEASPDGIDSSRTRRLDTLWVADTPLLAFGSPGEHERAAILAGQLDPDDTLGTLRAADVWSANVLLLKKALSALKPP
jgi:hypothetical protein